MGQILGAALFAGLVTGFSVLFKPWLQRQMSSDKAVTVAVALAMIPAVMLMIGGFVVYDAFDRHRINAAADARARASP